MKKLLVVLVILLVIVFIAMQFFPDRLPENQPPDERDITRMGMVSGEALEILKTSCFDCHSNQTNLPWYSKVAPSSWFLANHVTHGREELNFSEWGDYSKRKRVSMLEGIKDEVAEGKMPLKSYTLLHRDAKMTEQEIAIITSWTEQATGSVLSTDSIE